MFSKFLTASAATAMAAIMISGTASAAATNKQPVAVQKQQQAEKKYCLAYDNIVGTRVTRTECRTKAQWTREGVNVDAMIKG